MAFEVTGKLYKKMDTKQITDSFRKREYVIELVDGNYTQLIIFQLTQDNCDKLDNLNEGEEVKTTYNLRGREWINPQGEVKYFNSLDAWKLERVGEAVQAPAPIVQQAAPIVQETAPVQDDGDLPF